MIPELEEVLTRAIDALERERDDEIRGKIRAGAYRAMLDEIKRDGGRFGYDAHCMLYLEEVEKPVLPRSDHARLVRFKVLGVYGYALRPGDRVWFASEFGYDEPTRVISVDAKVCLEGGSELSLECKYLLAPRDYVDKLHPKYQEDYWIQLGNQLGLVL